MTNLKNISDNETTRYVTIPAGLKNADVYPDFIADLNALVAYGIQYSIVVN